MTYKGILKVWLKLCKFLIAFMTLIVCYTIGADLINMSNTALVLIGIALDLIAILLVFIIIKWGYEEAVNFERQLNKNKSKEEVNEKF